MIRCGVILLFILQTACVLNPKTESTKSRQQTFAKTKLYTQQPVEILWNDFGVPRVSAQSDDDLFYTVGALQMHLRQSQLEFLRMISKGRISEMAGSFAKDIDHFIKAMNFPDIAKKNWPMMTEQSRASLEAMAKGMNDYLNQNPKRPVDLRLAGVKSEPWTALDLAGVHRFIAIDINWMMYARILQFVEKPYYEKLWNSWTRQESFLQLLLQDQQSPDTAAFDNLESLAPESLQRSSRALSLSKKQDLQSSTETKIKNSSNLGTKNKLLEDLSLTYTRAGSNAFAVGKTKTQGAAVLSSDPHLGLMIPNLWMFMVLESPNYKTMGFMMPTFPVPALGRNEDIAWGGTNMWSISTQLSEISEEALKGATTREEKIKVRFGRDKKVQIREINGMLVVTDIPLFKYKNPLALYWVGTEPSDEVHAFLELNKAKNFEQFENAFSTYATSGQNFIYADVKGNVGKVAAFRQLQIPDVYRFPLSNLIADKKFKNVNELPKAYNPSSGFVVSANESLLSKEPTPISLFHAPMERVGRMKQLLENRKSVGLGDLREIQIDVYSKSADDLAPVILKSVAQNLSNPTEKQNDVLGLLKNWDGNYTMESKGAVVFEVLSSLLMEAYWESLSDALNDEPDSLQKLYSLYTRSTLWRADLQDALIKNSKFANDQDWATYLNLVIQRLDQYQSWGNFHPMTLSHPLSRIPIIGKRFKFYQGPYMGGNETLLKAAHTLSHEKATVNFGAQSRWMTDLSSLDENYFVLLGGQDGWLKSQNTNDQTQMWFDGSYIHVPFEKDAFVKAKVQQKF